ncbi:TPA: tail fiber assembly protein [Yersinia enterocolitica]
MKFYYSPSNNEFYQESWLGLYESLPDDLTEISQEVYLSFLSSAPEGKTRGNINGMPGWVDYPAPTAEQAKEAADVKKASLMSHANSVISPLQDAVDIGMATEEEAALLLEWKKYRVLLMRVDTSKAPDIEWPTPPVE